MQPFQTPSVAYRPLELYDENFERLMALIPELRYLRGSVSFQNRRNLDLIVRVIEQTRFTTTLVMTLRLKVDSRWITDPSVTLRIYHDARAAEVVSYQNRSPRAPLYPYPNPAMYSRFEKRRVNEFLGKLLDFCALGDGRFRRIYAGQP